MKFLILLITLASCSLVQKAQQEQGFSVSAQVSRNSVDDNKGIQIMVFPLDQPPK